MKHQLYTKKLYRHSVFRKIYGFTLCLGLFALTAFRPIVDEEVAVADCGVSTTLLNASFDSGAQGLSYQDDAFQSTSQPNLASGTWSANSGRSGGGLSVTLGGGANATVNNMSGGWAYTFNLSEAASVSLSFYYDLQLAANYETDEYGEAYYSIDGSESVLARLTGDNNGGSLMSTGWQLVNANLGQLSAGSHTIIIGAYNNKKTWGDEVTQIFIDDLTLSSITGLDVIENTSFEAGYGNWVDGGSDATLLNDAFYANSGSYSVRLRDNSGSASSTWRSFDLSAYDEISIDFSYYANSMETGEDFFLELSNNNGGSFSVIRDYDSGDEFFNGQRNNESVTISGPFSANSIIRFRCDASANSDQVYIDDVVISGCVANTGDTQAPSIPQNLSAPNITGESVDLSWSASTDNVGVTGYYIYQDGNLTPVATVTGTSTTINGLDFGSTHQFAVAAFDAAGNVSSQSQAIQITTLGNGAPVASIVANPTSGTAPLFVNFDASGSTDPEADPMTFAWEFGDGNTASGPSPSHTYQSIGAYTAIVVVSDNFGNTDTASVTISVTATPDTEAPSIPQNLIASNITETSVDLDWDASTDNEAVAGYYVYQDGNATPVATVTGTSTSIQGLSAGTVYSFTVAAFDAAGNISAESQVVQITTDINEAPTASFIANPTTGEAPLLVTFDASASTDPDGDQLSYSWDFGDGNTGTGVSPSHTYQSEGSYTVTLTVGDGQGNSDQATATITVTPGSECSPILVDSEDFESGWGIWIDGGTDAARVNNAAFANSGNYSIELRDNSATSFMTTGALDLSAYGEIIVEFSFVSNSFDSSTEDFRLQVANDGGAFNTVEEWNLNDEFVNGQRVNDAITITGPFSTNTQLRFRCDATADGDQVYIDDVVIRACPAEQVAPSIPQNLVAGNITESSVFLNWDSSTDNVGVAGYYVYQDGNPNPVATVTQSQTTVSGLNSLTSYSFTVAAFDASGNVSGQSQPVQITTTGACTQVTIYEDDFEEGLGIWQEIVPPNGAFTPGSFRVENPSAAASGTYVLTIQGDYADSRVSTKAIDLSAYTDIQFNFTVKPFEYFNDRDGFFLQMSTDGGNTYTNIEEYNIGAGTLIEAVSMDKQVNITGPFTNQTKFRFQADVNNTRGYGPARFDDISIKVCKLDSCIGTGNIALNRPATQSSTYGNGAADQGVDGVLSGNSPWTPNIVHTTNEAQPWWEVDLGARSQLDSLILFNRETNQNRLKDFYVLVSDNPMNGNLASLLQTTGVQYMYYPGFAGAIAHLPINLEGRYVRIQLEGSNFLHFAEAQLIGCNLDQLCVPPTVSIDPAGPFNEDGIMEQLSASPAGGIWSGAVTPNGMFDPTQGIGFYEVIYTYESAPGCSGADTIQVEVKPVSVTCDNPTNIALNRSASQSSTYGIGVADFAVDGALGGSSPWTADLQHTTNEAQPWWEVDLGGNSKVDSVIIFNRSTSQNRLRDFYVLISNTPMDGTLDALLQTNTITAIFHPGPAGPVARLGADVEGRYVRIQLSGSNILHMDEVEVIGCNLEQICTVPVVQIDPVNPVEEGSSAFQLTANPVGGVWSGAVAADGTFDPVVGIGTYQAIYTYEEFPGCNGADTVQIQVAPAGSVCSSPVNLAFNKSALQSSTYANGVAGIAVDGNTNGSSPWTADLQHTNTEFQPWWQVDLGSLSDIQEVVIHNRTDCCQGRLNNFYVLWSNQPFDTSSTLDQLLADPNVSNVNFSGSAGLLETIAVGAEGRYVRIQHTRDIQLHMAEVEVMGCISQNDPCFGAQTATIDPIPTLAPNSGAYQLSALPVGGVWSGDANADGTFTADACPGTYEVIYTYQNGGQCITADTATVLVQGDTMDVFIYAGQSNATGAQNTLNVLRVGNSPYDSQIAYSWNIPGTVTNASWDTLQAIQVDTSRRGHGAEISFGRTLFDAGYNNLGIIKVAKGGTNLANHWDPNSPLSGAQGNDGMYPEMISYVNARLAELDAAGTPYRLKGFLWHQGEGDMNPTMSGIYEANLAEFIGALRTDFGSDLSVYVASVYNPNATVEEGEAVRKAQRDVAAADPLTFVVNLDTVYFDANFNPDSENLIADNLHYNSTGQIKIGNSFAGTFLVFNPLDACEDTTSGGCSSPENLALNQPAEQSSTYGNGVAGLSVDGNRTGSDPWSADLQHTTVEFQPWWQVDLGEVSSIEEVVIYNRTDCCAGRLNNFYIMWSDQPFNSTDSLDQLLVDPNISHVNFSGSAGLLENIPIGSTGRYLRLQHTRTIQLHIPEIEVLGCPIVAQGNRLETVEETPFAQTLEPVVSVFPNPATTRVDFQVANVESDAIIEYSLYNLTGQRVWQKLGGRVEKLNVENLPSGTYLVKIQGAGWARTQKLMVW